MRSLRDQLVAKGLASKKDKRRIDREQRDTRKKKQGKRRKKKKVEAEAEAKARAQAEEAAAERATRHRETRQRQDQIDRHNRVRQLVFGNRLGGRGDVRFYFKTTDGQHLRFMRLPEPIAWRLRCGQAGIVATPGGDDYVVIRASAVRQLLECAPDLVVFFVQDTKGISDPSEGFNVPVQDVSLRCHRVSSAQPSSSSPRSDRSTSAQGTPTSSL